MRALLLVLAACGSPHAPPPATSVSDAELDDEATAAGGDGVTVRWTGKATANGSAIAIEGAATVRFADLVPVRSSIIQHIPPQSPDIAALDLELAIE